MLVKLSLLCCALTAISAHSTGFQLQQHLNEAISTRQPTFTLPAGDVRFARGERLLIARAANMVITGANTTLWFEPGGGLKVLQCENLSISGVVIDYDPLPYVQAEILAMAPAGDADQQPQQHQILPAAALAPCFDDAPPAPGPGPPGAKRPAPPCPHGWWQPGGSKLCEQVRHSLRGCAACLRRCAGLGAVTAIHTCLPDPVLRCLF